MGPVPSFGNENPGAGNPNNYPENRDGKLCLW